MWTHLVFNATLIRYHGNIHVFLNLSPSVHKTIPLVLICRCYMLLVRDTGRGLRHRIGQVGLFHQMNRRMNRPFHMNIRAYFAASPRSFKNRTKGSGRFFYARVLNRQFSY